MQYICCMNITQLYWTVLYSTLIYCTVLYWKELNWNEIDTSWDLKHSIRSYIDTFWEMERIIYIIQSYELLQIIICPKILFYKWIPQHICIISSSNSYYVRCSGSYYVMINEKKRKFLNETLLTRNI